LSKRAISTALAHRELGAAERLLHIEYAAEG
jgi:hypothetical protein